MSEKQNNEIRKDLKEEPRAYFSAGFYLLRERVRISGSGSQQLSLITRKFGESRISINSWHPRLPTRSRLFAHVESRPATSRLVLLPLSLPPLSSPRRKCRRLYDRRYERRFTGIKIPGWKGEREGKPLATRVCLTL